MGNKIWITFFLMLAGMAGWQANDVVDVVQDDMTCAAAEPVKCPGNVILAYVNNCETGAQDKYICEDVAVDANCINTEEILSELG